MSEASDAYQALGDYYKQCAQWEHEAHERQMLTVNEFMPEELQVGKATVAGKDNRGWMLGHFINDQFDLRRTKDVEVKWGVHKHGDTNGGFTFEEDATTLSILVRGQLHFKFKRGNLVQAAVLKNEGDYALWTQQISHEWQAKGEETVIVTVRWPSLRS